MTGTETRQNRSECWVETKWLTPNEATRVGDDIIVRINRGEEKTVDRGAVWSERELFVGVKGDVVCMKYKVERSGGSDW
jgi:hypothetical protein